MFSIDIEVINPGPGRLIRALIDELRIVETINHMAGGTKNNGNSRRRAYRLSNYRFFSRRKPLYKVWNFYEGQDLEFLFGRADLIAEDFTDDSLGRALDR